MTRKLVGAVGLCIVSVVALGGPAMAGEVTGNGKTTPIKDRAASECAFSGLEDGVSLIGFNPDGSPIFAVVESGPGLVQTPHMENAAGIVHPAGLAGMFCRGNG